MSGNRNTSLWRARKRAVARAPVWLRTAVIAKPARRSIRGTFGAASPAVRIDPQTGLPLSDGGQR